MSAAATQSPPTPRCRHCGARMAPEQDWCLECGNAVTTRIARPPSWRVPVAVALGTLAVFAAGVALAVAALSDDADDAAAGDPRGRVAAATAPPRTTTGARTAPRRTGTTAAPGRTATTRTNPAAAPTPTQTVPGAVEATGGGPVPIWPSARQAYTIVVTTTTDRAAAERRARQLIRTGQDAGILRTNGYDFFSDGYWVVWSGRYADRASAERAAPRVRASAPGAYITLIRRGDG